MRAASQTLSVPSTFDAQSSAGILHGHGHAGLRRQVADEIRAAGECLLERVSLGDVQLLEPRAFRHVRARARREVVDDEHVVAALHEHLGDVRADEAGSSGHDDARHPDEYAAPARHAVTVTIKG